MLAVQPRDAYISIFAANRLKCNTSFSGFHQTLTNCWRNVVDSYIKPQASIRMNFVVMGWEVMPSTFNTAFAYGATYIN